MSRSLVAADAMKKNMGSPSAIRDQVRKIDLPMTPFGPIKFDARGQNAHPVLVTQIQNQQYKVVWPAGRRRSQAHSPRANLGPAQAEG